MMQIFMDENKRKEEIALAESRRWDDLWLAESRRKEKQWRAEARERKAESQRRKEQMQQQITEATKPQPARVRVDTNMLLKLVSDTPVDFFVKILESRLSMAEVPEEQWKSILVGQLDRIIMANVISDPDSIYDGMVREHRKGDGETSFSAARRYYMTEPDLTKFTDTRKALRVVGQWVEKMIEGLDTKQEIAAAFTRARVCAWHCEQLRSYLDQKYDNSHSRLIAEINNWKANTHDESSEFSPRRIGGGTEGKSVRKTGECYVCGKPGNFAKDCREAGKSTTNSTQNRITSDENTSVKSEGRVVKCFECGEIEHKRQECPKKDKKTRVV